jgi:hypothetical protein
MAKPLIDRCHTQPKCRKAVTLYHLFFLSLESGGTDLAEIQSGSDEQAIADARKEANGRMVVVWCGSRCVGADRIRTNPDRARCWISRSAVIRAMASYAQWTRRLPSYRRA